MHGYITAHYSVLHFLIGKWCLALHAVHADVDILSDLYRWYRSLVINSVSLLILF